MVATVCPRPDGVKRLLTHVLQWEELVRHREELLAAREAAVLEVVQRPDVVQRPLLSLLAACGR